MKFNKIYDSIRNFIKNNLFDIIILSFFCFASFYKFDYLVYRPGGAIDLSDRIKIENKDDINGSYSLSYVSVSEGNLVNIIASYLVKDWDLVKKEEVTYSDIDYETSLKIDKLSYKNSIDIATMVAYSKAGKTVDIKNENITVISIDDNATTDIELLDNIISIDDKKIKTLQEIRDYINTLDIGSKVNIKVYDKYSKEQERYAYVYESNNSKIIGILPFVDYEYKLNPKLTIESSNTEAGSSGGFMLALSIYDLLVSDDLAQGYNIQGTGTIDIDGTVGEIGGIKYKLLGAKKNKSDIFFVPKANYKEAKKLYKKYNMKFDLVSVETIDDAINYLNNIK